jgi:hemin uptake protein HemP
MIALRHQTPATPPHPATRPASLPSHAARDLTAGGTQAQIELDGQIYTLRITRAGKLILTK